jgi:hypothetical protein
MASLRQDERGNYVSRRKLPADVRDEYGQRFGQRHDHPPPRCIISLAECFDGAWDCPGFLWRECLRVPELRPLAHCERVAVCLHRARVGEIAQLRKADVIKRGGIHALKITPEAGTVKNARARAAASASINAGLLEVRREARRRTAVLHLTQNDHCGHRRPIEAQEATSGASAPTTC